MVRLAVVAAAMCVLSSQGRGPRRDRLQGGSLEGEVNRLRTAFDLCAAQTRLTHRVVLASQASRYRNGRPAAAHASIPPSRCTTSVKSAANNAVAASADMRPVLQYSSIDVEVAAGRRASSKMSR